MKNYRKFLPDMVAVVLFVLVATAYFIMPVSSGKILFKEDASAGRGANVELSQYHEQTGEETRWTNSVFGGMPTYQMAPSYDSGKPLGTVMSAYHLWLPDYIWFVFAYLLGFYILLRAFDYKWYLAVLGSVIWAFSSYFFIIIAAGHIWKVYALAYLPPMIAGIVLAYRGKYLPGLLLTAVFTAFEIKANHVQMTYYYLFIVLFLVIGWLVEAIRKKNIAHFAKASAACLIGAAIGISLNMSSLYHTWEYGQESMRGKSELVKKDAGNQTSSGLERDYITQWSYGIDETWTLLIPNAKGGASMPMSQSETAMKKADPAFGELYSQIGQYWGEQPGTSGPVYVGAFVLMLFVLGLFIVKGPVKWALFAATILSVLLSWGRNFMPLTDFFIDYVPMYAKFRTVASILVIAEFTIPLLAVMALKEIVDDPELLRKKMKWVWTSLALTGGFCLLFWMIPTLLGDVVSTQEMGMLQQGLGEYFGPVLGNLREMRFAVLQADCLRSLWIIIAGFCMLMAYRFGKLKAEYMVALITVLCLVDMWQVNKRYLNDGMFVESGLRDAPVEPSEADREILKDKSQCGNYRVLNLASNTFNENETSYFHKSIGGYHAAKMRRYQELIERHITPEMKNLMPAVADAQGDMTAVKGDSIWPVLNMLNARYFIFPLKENGKMPIRNDYAFGNAWYVSDVQFVDNANEEIDALGKLDLRRVAVADRKFEGVLSKGAAQDSASVVTLKDYKPNHLVYDAQSAKGGTVVFSEIYYPGWTATVDGEPVEVGRVNYVLRAVTLKPGKHEVVLDFHPVSVRTTEGVAYAGYILLLFAAAGVVWKNRKKKQL